MKNVIVRCDDDFNKIDENTRIIEFYKYGGLFDVSNLELENITFTKMDVDINSIPMNIKELGLFDSDFNFDELYKFQELEVLEITNRRVDIVDVLKLKKIYTLNLNFDEILNIDRLCELETIENISIISTNLKNFEFLFSLKNLKSVAINIDEYSENKDLFLTLAKRGGLVSDMMGGIYNEI